MGKHLLISAALGSLVLPLGAADKITYDDNILPLFQQSCLNCHNPDKAKGGLDLSTYAGAMKGGSGGKIVEPGDTGSKLLVCVMQTAEPKMPPEGDKLPAEQISLLKAWIESGLLENKTASARVRSKPKFDTALSASAGKPEGPPPMPEDGLLEPAVVARRASPAHAMVASPWAPLLAVTGEKQVLLYNTTSLELCGILPFPEGDPVSLSFTPNSRYLIVGGGIPGKSGVTVTFDIVTGERMLVAAKEFDSVLAADLTPDLSTVATGSPSRLVKMWKSEDGEMIRSIKKHTDWVTALDYSPDGILLATGDRNGGVWVWESGSGNEFQTLRAHQAGISAVSFRGDSNLLATASEDGTVRFWEMNGGTEVKKIDAHPGGVLGFSWCQDGSFSTCGRDRSVRVWKADFNLAREIKDLPDIPLAVACDFEGKRVFAADYRGQITAWDVASGEIAGHLDANPPQIDTRLMALRAQLTEQPAQLAAAVQTETSARERLEAARQKVNATEAAIAQAKGVIEQTMRQSQELAQRSEALGQERTQKETAARELLTTLEALKKEQDQAAATLAAVDQKIASASREHDEAQTGLKLAEDELEKARAENRNDSVASLEQAASGQREKAAMLTRQLEEARSERQRADGVAAEIGTRNKTATADHDRLTHELAAASKACDEAKAAAAMATQTLESSRNQLKEAEAALPASREALPGVEKQFSESSALLTAAREKETRLQQQIRFWEAAAINAECLRAKAEADRQKNEAEALTADFTTLSKTLEEAGPKLAENRRKLSAAESHHSGLVAAQPQDAAQVSEAEKEISALKSQISQLEKDTESARTELPAIRQKMDATLPAADASKARVEELKGRYLAMKDGK